MNYLRRFASLGLPLLLTLLLSGTAGAFQLTPDQLRQLQQMTPQERTTVLRVLEADPNRGAELLGRAAAPTATLDDAATTTAPRTREAAPAPAIPSYEDFLAQPGDQLVITYKVPDDPREAEAAERVLRERVFRVDERGQVNLPLIGPISVIGLDEQQILRRLKAERTLENLQELNVLRLPYRRVERDVQRFGHDLFSEAGSFAPVSDIPVPTDYVVGPGDTVNLTLFGAQSGSYELMVGRDGSLNVPGIGPVNVAGLRYEKLQPTLEKHVRDRVTGARVSVGLGRLRSIRVFVLGEVQQPGSYTVSSLSSMTNALFASGGVRPIGSLRNVELKRAGKTVTRLDLYDLLLAGDTRNDARLQPGDVIFVPPVGRTIQVDGAVRRPAIYELKDEKTIGEVLALAGGTEASANLREAQLERISEQGVRMLVDLDLSAEAGLKAAARSGDRLIVSSVLDRLDNAVTVTGHVERERRLQWRQGLRLSDVIPNTGLLLPRPDLDYAIVRRELAPDRRLQALSVRLGEALAAPGGEADTLLAPGDRIMVFSATEARGGALDTFIEDLRIQATRQRPERVVNVTGQVRFPGDYPLEVGMRVSDLLRAGGHLTDSAYLLGAELTRYAVVDGVQREIEHTSIDLNQILAGDKANDPLLMPYDTLTVKQITHWGERAVVVLSGEVRFPGSYPIRRGETLTQVIERAGGFTDDAFLFGAVFQREELKRREREQLNRLAQQLESDIAAAALQADEKQRQAIAQAQGLLDNLKRTEAVGRLVINLSRIVDREDDDIALEPGDRLHIPTMPDEVAVLGEVHFPSSHRYDGRLERDDYIGLSGGTTSKSDEKRVYVIRADGTGQANTASLWFRSGSQPIQRGDTIVVPLDVDRVKPITLWSNVAQIVYQIALAAAAFKTVGAF
ncbi:MAG: SLBB domain-containing protein [Chromatiales bacterium]|nr:SLBB domain-containing protein [Chromatiales bacterium]